MTPEKKSAPDLDHPHRFDPTYGYDWDRLLKVPSPEGPADFAAFWRNTHSEAREVPLEITRRPIASPHPDYALYEVEFNSLDGMRIGGWLTVPHQLRPEVGAWVVGHGYGGREAPAFDLPGPAAPAIFPCARGFHRSAHPEIPNTSSRHVLHGIGSRETYVHRGCAADVWCAASALLEILPGTASDLRYYGGSFGGGIGALALPWDERFQRGFLDIPSFGNHPLRVQLPCVGSGEFVRYHHRQHPEVLDVLAYFDAATAARHMRQPVFVAAALFDPAVPPPGQFAVYNALPSPKGLFVRSAAHFESRFAEPEGQELRGILTPWFFPDHCPSDC